MEATARPPVGRPPDCLKCVHFRVSWDPRLPRSCLVFGVKCARLPSVEIRRATGRDCPEFARKPGLR